MWPLHGRSLAHGIGPAKPILTVSLNKDPPGGAPTSLSDVGDVLSRAGSNSRVRISANALFGVQWGDAAEREPEARDPLDQSL
jgi:hypothetical protein